MHRFRSWTFDPPEFRSQRNRLLPIEGGDGSTLSLDFTTGVLDPRLTFTRGSNATFINSSGMVQWADANLMRNSNWSDANAVPTSWASAGNAPTIPSTGSRTFTVTTAAVSYVVDGGPAATGIQGITYTASINVTAVSGSPNYNNTITATAFASGEKWYRNGSLVNGTDVVQPGLITYVFTSGNGSLVRVGIGTSGVSQTNQSITLTQPRLMPGVRLDSPYFASSTTAPYYGPRFDHDPTTLAPRGLLIEGSASTLNQWSEDYTQTYWQKNNVSISSTSVTCPDGVARTTVRVTDNSTTSQHSIRRGITTSAGTTYTLSWFVKKGSTNTFAVQMYWNNAYYVLFTVSSIDNNTQTVTSPAGVNAAVTRVSYPTHGWYRYSMTFTHPSAVTGAITPDFNFHPINNVGSYSGSGNHTDFFGIQLEAGSGASSYIPTGGSTVTRNADKMSMVDITSMQWNQTAGTFYLHMDVVAETNTVGFPSFMGMYTATPVRVVRFILNNSSGTNPRITLDTWTSTPTSILPTSLITRSTAPTAFKYAAALSNTGQSLSHVVNNGSVTTITGTGTMQTPTRLLWHQDPSAADTEFFPVHIRSMKYWPTNLSDATLQSLTT